MSDKESSSGFGITAILMPILAALGLFFGVRSGSSNEPAPAPARTIALSTSTLPGKADDKALPVNGPMPVLGSYLAITRESCGAAWTALCLKRALDARGHQASALVVTIPDPESSSLAQYTDQALEAIQKATEAEGYQFRRFWLPWSKTRSNESPTETLRQPGVLIFDKADFNAKKPPALLLVFLAPEAPKSGLDRQLFAQALDYAGAFSLEFKIVGPSFTGSSVSLRMALAHYAAKSLSINASRFDNCDSEPIAAGPKFSLVSGSATGSKNVNTLNCPAMRATYRSTRTDDKSVESWLEPWLRSHGLNQLGLLSESDTAYGSAFDHESKIKIAYYPFSSEISRVRAAYDEDADLKKGKQSSGSQQRTTLELRPNANGEYRGRIPMYAPDTTPILQEKVLLEYARAAREKRHDLVQVAATDPRDLMFLVDFFRSRLRDPYYLVFDSDHLFAAESTYSLNGLLTVADYPIFREAKPWHGKSPTAASMPSQFANGVFNAVTVQLTSESALLDQRDRRRIDKGPVWISMAASGASWPIALLSETQPSVNPTAWAAPVEWHPALWILGLVTALYVWASVIATLRPDTVPDWAFLLAGGSRWTADEARAQTVDPDTAGQDPAIAGGWFRTLLPAILASLLGFMAASFCLVEWVRLATFCQPPSPMSLWLAALSLLLLLSLNIWQLRHAPITHQAAALVPWISLLGLAWALFAPPEGPDVTEGKVFFQRTFFFYRSIHLTSGVSPLTPFVLLAVMGISMVVPYMRLLGTLRTYRLPGGVALTRLDGLSWITASFGFRGWQIVGATILVFGGQWVLLSHFRTFEGEPFRWGFLLFSGALAIFMLGMVVRLLNLLSGAQELMNRAYLSSLADNFRSLADQHLPIGLWRGFGGYVCAQIALLCSIESDKLLPADDPKRVELRSAVDKLQIGIEVNSASQWRRVADAITAINPLLQSRGEDADTFYALQYCLYLQQLIYRCQAILQGGFVALILAIAALQSYQFHSGFTLRWIVVAFFLLLAGLLIFAFYGLERHPLLRAVQGRENESVGFQFYLRLVTTLGLPLLTILASLFPGEVGWLFRWIGPILGGLPQ